MNSLLELLPIALLGGVCGLDVVSFPQAMISRPIVSATLAGALLGNATGGVLVGAVLELIALETLPFGASRYPEWGSAGVVGGALVAPYPMNYPGALPVVVLATLLTAAVSGSSLIGHRRLIGVRFQKRRALIDGGSGRAVVSLQLFGLTMDLIRGALIASVAFAIFRPLVAALIALWRTNPAYSPAVVVALAAIVASGALWKVFHQAPHAVLLFLAGLAAGVVVLGMI